MFCFDTNILIIIDREDSISVFPSCVVLFCTSRNFYDRAFLGPQVLKMAFFIALLFNTSLLNSASIFPLKSGMQIHIPEQSVLLCLNGNHLGI